jgi:hypothetical protein
VDPAETVNVAARAAAASSGMAMPTDFDAATIVHLLWSAA